VAVPNFTSAPARIPRFVRRLTEYAECRGVAVKTYAGPYSNDPEIRLWSEWRTSQEQFLALEFLTPGNRLPYTSGYFTVPMGFYHRREDALMAGDMTIEGGNVLWEIDFGPAEFDVAERGGVEIVTYADETLFHGSVEALIAAGIDPKRLPVGKRPSKRSLRGDYDHPVPQWRSRRQLDGSIVYRVESAKALRARHEEQARWYAQMRPAAAPVATKPRPSYLRLVVDND